MKMKMTDVVVVVFMYAVCALFAYMNLSIKEAAQTYPWFVISLLFVLTTMYLIKILYNAVKNGVEGGWQEAFEGFLVKQFLPIVVFIIAYAFTMYYLGFYIATLLFVTVTLLFLKLPKWQIVIVVAVLLALVYCAFTMFLGVKLPQGVIIKALF